MLEQDVYDYDDDAAFAAQVVFDFYENFSVFFSPYLIFFF